MLKLWKSSLVLVGTLCMLGCAPQPPLLPLTDAARYHLMNQLQQEGVQTNIQGQRLTLLLPVNNFFLPGTTELTDDAPKALDHLTLYLRDYLANVNQNAIIHVTGYTDASGTRAAQMEFSHQYASVIASYLWSRGVPPSQIVVKAGGSTHPIGDNKTTSGREFNRRILITAGPGT
jgi:outer membrane protein OmpA-like peptidoglycan-associated protein